jgi:hypothetical protein
MTCALGTATMTAWCWYTLSIGDTPALASSLGPLVCWALCVFGLYRHGGGRKAVLITGFALTITVAACASGFAQYLAVAGSLGWALPQVRSALRGGDLSGVSGLAYSLIAAENVAWIIYAAGTGTWAYAVAPLVQGPAAILIAHRVLRAKHEQPDELSSSPEVGRTPSVA